MNVFHLVDRWPNAITDDEVDECAELVRGLEHADLERMDRVRIDAVRRWHREYIRDVIHPLVAEMKVTDEVWLAPSLNDLVHILKRKSRNGSSISRRRWEAMKTIHKAFMLDERERLCPQQTIKRDVWNLRNFLNDKWIRPGDPAVTTFWSYHDPSEEGEYKVVEIGVGERLHRGSRYEQENPLALRVTNAGHQFHSMPDDKLPENAVMKMWKSRLAPKPKDVGRDPSDNDDRRLKFVGTDLDSTLAMIEEFTAIMEADGAQVRPDGDNLLSDGDEKVDHENTESDPGFKSRKFMVSWHGVWYEVQFLELAQHLNTIYSIGRANHDLYKLRQALNFYLPLMYRAPDVYQNIAGGWGDKKLKDHLRKKHIERIGWKRDTLKHAT